MVIKNKHERMNQLTAMLEAHPDGLRKAEIARRLEVHRSTVGRYIDQLSLRLPIWERDSRIGLESVGSQEGLPGFDIYEGTFILFLLKLYEQELNIKNPHASSFIRKISGHYRNTAPVLYQNLLKTADSLEIDEKRYSRGYNENFEKLSASWIGSSPIQMNYLHKATGESCSGIYEPLGFFTSRKLGQVNNTAVCGLCRRTGEQCSLFLSDFSVIEDFTAVDDAAAIKAESFCPLSEFAREARPNRDDNRNEEYSIKEANHRIKNSLFMTSGLIDITFAENKEKEITEKIKGLQNRIDAIAEVHELLSENTGSNYIQLDRYFEKLIWKNITALSSEPAKIETRLRIDDILLDAGKVLSLGMIVSELITNSFKYAIKTELPCITLNITKQDGTISVKYGDGESKINLSTQNGKTGHKLIEGVCRQLDCKITYKNKYILLEFPS